MKNTLHPTWVKFEISSQTLCSSDPARKIQVRPTLVTRLHARIFKFCSTFCSLQVTCYDWDSDGSHDLIGHFTTTLGEITEAYQTQKKACTSSYLDSSLTVVDESFPPPPPLPPSFPFSSSLSPPQLQWECINPGKLKKRKYKNSGTVYLNSVKVSSCHVVSL